MSHFRKTGEKREKEKERHWQLYIPVIKHKREIEAE
jgi:hypothetical protein